jgi:hypothetical protein
MTIVSGGLFVAIPLLHRGVLLANSELAAKAIVDVGQYVLVVVALFLVPMGMIGFHTLQKWNYGLIGHTGLWMSVISSMVVASSLAGYLRWEDSTLLWLVSPVGALGLVVGFILYGVATLQARILPPWCGIAFMAALPAAIALIWIRPLFGLGEGASTTSIMFGFVWLGLGYNLWTRRRESR